ncbi:hypothetical protein [Actinacidiphila oryziradicis]|uniref:Uncharacterized protein n=1 Tax=Actinacidiphila oryziradicis TaxID=2571141 RepID=A0A4U0RJG6_9ACTN|nr:hypothetical protein [Actinacidiphila oryziradicis]TJZ95839.1 hypothetical protein FCI23_51805 [Actinacidiphila oryziradicis]
MARSGDAEGGHERTQACGDRLLTGHDGHHAGFEVIAGRIGYRVLAAHLLRGRHAFALVRVAARQHASTPGTAVSRALVHAMP